MGCIGSRVALFRSCSFTSGSHSGSLTSSSGGLGGSLALVGSANAAEAAARRASRRQNTFSVQNVDDTGQGVSPGKLEVTETDLVLHVKGKLPLTWPLKSLRRYGFDNELFSFESGRRCPTGAGIFAFRCHRAQSLFNLLQSKIQGGGQAGAGSGSANTAVSASLPTLPSTPITPTNNAGTPLASQGGAPGSQSQVSTPVSSTFVYVNLSENNSSRIISSGGIAPPIPPPSSAAASNVESVTSSADVRTRASSHPTTAGTPPATSASSFTASSSTSARGPLLVSKPSLENHPVYMNVESHGGALFAAASVTQVTTSFTTTHTNIPPPTAPRRVSTSSEKSNAPSAHHSHPHPHPSGISQGGTCSHVTSGTSGGGTLPDCALYSNVFCNLNNSKGTSSAFPSNMPLVGATTSTGGIVLPLPVEQETAELNYAELDLKTDRPSSSSQSSPYSSASGRLGLYNRHHQLISTYARTAEPYNAGRLSSVTDEPLVGGETSVQPSSRLLEAGIEGDTASEQNNGELGYATIDFDKTAQLNKITRSKLVLGFEDDDSSSSKKGGSSLSKKLKYGTTGL